MNEQAEKPPESPPPPPPYVAVMLAAYSELTQCLTESMNVISPESILGITMCQTFVALAKVNAIADFLVDPPKDPNQSADERLIGLITIRTKELTAQHKALVEQAKQSMSRIARLPMAPPNPTPHGPMNGRRR